MTRKRGHGLRPGPASNTDVRVSYIRLTVSLHVTVTRHEISLQALSPRLRALGRTGVRTMGCANRMDRPWRYQHFFRRRGEVVARVIAPRALERLRSAAGD